MWILLPRALSELEKNMGGSSVDSLIACNTQSNLGKIYPNWI